MLDKMTDVLGFHAKALVLRAERQRTLASTIANADTPGYVARDFNFSDAMGQALQSGTLPRMEDARTNRKHLPLTASSAGERQGDGYSVQSQPNLDNSTVDLDRERANFVDNTVRYEAALRFINGQSKTMLAAIQGQ